MKEIEMWETTETGWRASDGLVAFWEARDACPGCTAIVSPTRTVDGTHHYECRCEDIAWTRQA